MISKVKVTTIFECSLERAFKTAMLCDLSKIHTGFGFTPKVTHTTDDENWGIPGSSKKVYTAKSLFLKGGFSSIDNILERHENQYWKIQVDEFQNWTLGFYKFVGEWKTTQIAPNKILVEYSYTLHSKNRLLYPIDFLFAKTFWKIYMKHVLKNVQEMAYNNEPYLYA
ncbi:MAG: hypothetical protein ACPG4Z_04490 [Chitinophagales bacterium]